MEFNAPAELGWQALKYAARRLPDVDCAAFEEQLADDQTAREAVAQAVELSHTVAVLHACGGPCERALIESPLATEPAVEVAASVNSYSYAPQSLHAAPQWTWQRAAAWMSLVVAACLAIVLASSHWFPANSAADQATANDLVSSNWADLHNSREPSGLPLLNEVAVDDGTTPDDNADSSDEAGMVPEWLLLGVEKDAP